MDINAAQKSIMEAAVSCIEKYGIENVTVRKIADEAGTNIASINYYFRSKKNLIDATLKMTINHMMEDVIAAIDDKESPFDQILEEVFFYLIDGAARFPGISTAHLYSAIIGKDYDSPGVQGMRNAFDHLVSKAAKAMPDKSAERIRFILTQLFYAAIFLMLAPEFFPSSRNYNVNNPGSRRKIASEYSRMYFASI